LCMDSAKAAEVRQWLVKADHDLQSAQRLMAGDPPLLDTAVYHCQQAAEKSLKAYLALNDVPIQRIHILGILLEQCMQFDASFSTLQEIADVLTPFAVAFRYPGDYVEPEPGDAEDALKSAGIVFDFVVARMPGEITSGQ
jgi:HEPN domain-containing protein